jgi:acyl carrier protein
VLASRSGKVSYAGQGLEERLAKLQASTEVHLMQCDTSDESSVKALLEKVRGLGRPLKGVVHAAGVLSDAKLTDQTAESLTKSLNAKAQGAWYLHKHTQADNLSAFAMFSSVASLFGNVGQTNYSAANSYLDALAGWRRTQKLPGLSVQWPAVSGVGMAADMEGLQSRSITPEQVGEAFRGLLLQSLSEEQSRSSAAQAVLPPAMLNASAVPNWLTPFAANVVEKVVAPATSSTGAARPGAASGAHDTGVAAEMAGMSDEEQLAHVTKLVSQVVQRVMGEEVSAEANLADEGLTSLDSTELVNMLSERLGITIEPTLLLDNQSISAISGAVLGMVGGSAAAPAAAAEQEYESVSAGATILSNRVVSLASCTVLMPTRKPRVLFLHGFAADAPILSKLLQLQGWKSRLESAVDMVFVDAPHATAALPDFEPYRPLNGSNIYDKDTYRWWGSFAVCKQIATHAQNFGKGSTAGSVPPVAEAQWGELWAQTVQYLKDVIEKFGPFDGVAGVSEGAIVAQWLTMKQSQPKADGGVMDMMMGGSDAVDLGPFARFRFCLNIVGPPPDLAFQSATKSLHVIGKTDDIFNHDEIAAQINKQFVGASVQSFDGGHTIPPLTNELAATTLAFIEDAMKD